MCFVALCKHSGLLECSPLAVSAVCDMGKLIRLHGMEDVFQIKFGCQGW